MDFNKDKKQVKERLKGIVVFVNVQNNASRQKEIKERVIALGGVSYVFSEKLLMPIIIHK